MFWGLIMEPQRRYTQSVKKPFHVSMAALDESTSDNSPTQVICTFDERNYLLCTLQKGKTSQVSLDLNFEIGDQISFATNGQAHVHLTGYLTTEQYLEDIEEEEDEEDIEDAVEDEVAPKKKRQKSCVSNSPPRKKSKTLELLEAVNSDDDDDSDDSDVNMSDLMEEDELDTTGIEEEVDDDDDDDLEDEIEEEDDSDDDEDIEDEEFDEDSSSMSDDGEVQQTKKVVENGVANRKQRKLNAKQDAETPQQQLNEKRKKGKTGDKTPAKGDKTPAKSDKTPAKGDKTPGKGDKSPARGDQSPVKNGKSSPKVEKTPAAGNKTVPKSPKQAQQGDSPLKKTVEGGVVIQDLKVGNGQLAKPGKFVRVYYEGKFKNNNKMFDSTTKGPGFEFRLGRQEVIKGWDVGVSGMKVGGKRRIICPPNMAYGQKGSPPTIPPNSTLVFEVELKNVK